MTVPALRIVAWSAALLDVGVAVVITLARTRPGVPPNISLAMETRSVRDDPLLAPIIDTNERTLGAEDKDPDWSTFPLQLLQKKFEPSAEDAVWNGRQPIDSFLKALDLDFREPTPGGLNSYGTPVVVGYVNRPPEKTAE